jgi:hypothetical protein
MNAGEMPVDRRSDGPKPSASVPDASSAIPSKQIGASDMTPPGYSVPNPRVPIRLADWAYTPDSWDGFEHAPKKQARLMLPTQGRRSLRVGAPGEGPIVIANASEHGVVSDWLEQPCCRAVMNGKLLIVDGLQRACRIAIELQQGDAKDSIWITVKEELTVPIIAHYVEHGPVLKTRTTSPMLQEMIDLATAILKPQANVRVVLDHERMLTHEEIGERLGRTVIIAEGKKRDEWGTVTAYADRTTGKANLLNLFLVRRVDEPGKVSPRAETANGCCIFEDQITDGQLNRDRAGQTLAHEVCHHLGIPGELYGDNEVNRLMYWKDGGKRLTADEADQINWKGVGKRH